MATAAAAVVARAKRLIQHHFFAADAVRPDRAVAFAPDSRIEERLFARYREAGVIHEESPGYYWLDLPAYDRLIQDRFARVRMALLLLVAVFVGLAVLGANGVFH
ncbi:hypothetical protein [Sphingomonas astaxanthinifaciens]|uniref:Uncharacterized protein n=1 Tax=Sphingomonas astaxanthinifaciens DSM 22298 TaxID=1123267 RepID=A0ABQ5Z7E5_9SPHN|nr:hypothetical protein [Sphingomonas astaxanthinifaciens]GLR48704.1 hypothetical protein GCM10007925_24240 [Sphingomonas astaxanthinifaciens DSM 22298]